MAGLLGLLASGIANAQFPLVNTSPNTIHTLHSLGSGTRYIDNFNSSAQQRTIYNLDLSVHRVLNIPAPPSGMQWGSMSYITEALFDTDPSTIEFVMSAYTPGGPSSFAVYIYREDGTLVFVQNPGSFVSGGGGGAIGINAFSPIYAVDGQAYMLLFTNNVFGPPTRIFALPGMLPCTDCMGNLSPSGIGTGADEGFGAPNGIHIFPNPANEVLTVTLGSQQQAAVLLRLYDGLGRLALERHVAAADRVYLEVGSLAAGTYVCQVFVAGELRASLPVVLER